MNQGEMVQVGTPEEIYEQPATRFVAQFVGHANLLYGTVTAVEAGGVSVACGKLMFHAAQTAVVTPGQAVALALRYERTMLADGDEGAPGIVAERSFLGDSVRIVVTMTDGTTLNADIPTSLRATPPTGAQVRLKWRADDVRVLTA
jgi:ABC-type Fe3+/spermidine/putrescine transport system ATPase subunit